MFAFITYMVLGLANKIEGHADAGLITVGCIEVIVECITLFGLYK